MARGNQREKAREKNLKAQAAQKSKNSKSGTEMQRDKEAVAEMMRKKQAAGKIYFLLGRGTKRGYLDRFLPYNIRVLFV
ncbi:hypothetical protein F5Y00DRAFT_228667, partial [Daldinia vernicosa]|uniref:uncharacterized protein n=1 Tax=Daldinia vernicosa TaxID=114800 RepID=UPI0020089965